MHYSPDNREIGNGTVPTRIACFPLGPTADMTERPMTVSTLADALRRTETMGLDPIQMRDMKSAARTACRWFKLRPDQVPADPVALRRLFHSISAGGEGVTLKRRANVKAGVRRLLDLAGGELYCTRRQPLTEDWLAVTGAVSNRYERQVIERFGRFCSARQISPDAVSDTHASAYLADLERRLRVSKPLHVHRETVRLWNRAAEASRLSYATLAVPSYTRTYVFPWETFHPDLRADVEAFLSRQATADPFDLSAPVRALKPSSIETYRDRLRRFATCVVLAGAGVDELRSLADLVRFHNVERGLRRLVESRGVRPLASTLARLLVLVARDQVGLPDDEVKAIASVAARLRAPRSGLTGKVRDRLRPLKHQANLAKLFLMPTALARGLSRKPETTTADARLFQKALALSLLTVCPLRMGSLCALRFDRHLNWSRGSCKGDLFLEFGPGELKNGEPASFPIPKDVAQLIRLYCSRYRPLLDPGGSPFLFCSTAPDRPKGKGAFSTTLKRLIFQRLGLTVHPHLFRHLVHLVVLRRFPGAYAMVARVLGHRSITTTMQNYAHFDSEIAMRAYQNLVDGLKSRPGEEHGPSPKAAAYALDQERFGRGAR